MIVEDGRPMPPNSGWAASAEKRGRLEGRTESQPLAGSYPSPGGGEVAYLKPLRREACGKYQDSLPADTVQQAFLFLGRSTRIAQYG